MKPSGPLVIVGTAVLALASSACRETVLQGGIQVPDSEVENIAVRIVPEADIGAWLGARTPQALAELEERQRAFESASRGEDAAIGEHQEAVHAATADATTRDGVTVVSNGDGSGLAVYDSREHTREQAKEIGEKTLPQFDRDRAAAAERLAVQRPALERATKAGRDAKEDARQHLLAWETDMLADIAERGEVVYTDADGRFTAKLPRGERVAIVAMGDFRIGGTVQDRAWGLWLALDASDKPIVLDENKLLLGSPRDSLLR